MVSNQQEKISNYFLEQAKLNASSSGDDINEDENEPLPNELNTVNSSGGFLVVSTDKLSVKYTNVNLHGHDVGVIQANHPAPVKRIMYYFEMTVKNAGTKGQIAIGFTTESFKMRRQPGWEANSYGYHGDDGLLYRGHGKGETFGPTFTTGDVVGGGINYASEGVFFTKNGHVVGTVYKDVKSQLFPTIAVHSQNEEVTVNFGEEEFLFDLESHEVEERLRQQSRIEKLSLPQNISYGIVRSYLLHYGYEDTLNVLDAATSNSVPPINVSQQNGFIEQDKLYALNQRKTLRQLIRMGQIDDAFGKLRDWYPQIIPDDNSPVCFLLHSQNFIELVRVGKLEDAVKYGRVELAKFFGLEEYKELIRECVALLAYEEPLKSPVGHLLGESQREIVADAVNAMVLSTNSGLKDPLSCLHSQLEKLLRQLTACVLERRSFSGGQGETFNLHQALSKTCYLRQIYVCPSLG
ncbi:ran-binding protein M homolog [Beta vulgaris subsp. vulgaris]|uniref:ran-binding protein M homolog n=1 Tax=Beta vulgaris subsp. vulgaris TaxID=3555 RepID=UPI002036E553|nr:ran-binding protein M homolog [Beta vulgaris subsp. vulgaris]